MNYELRTTHRDWLVGHHDESDEHILLVELVQEDCQLRLSRH